MFMYGQYVLVNDDHFYKKVYAKVLDKRLYNNEIQYLVALDPLRWLPERKLQVIPEEVTDAEVIGHSSQREET